MVIQNHSQNLLHFLLQKTIIGNPNDKINLRLICRRVKPY